MLFPYEIPHNKTYMQKVYLPYDKKTQKTNSVIFSNNISYNDVLTLSDSKIFNNTYKFIFYYIEYMYREKIGTKLYVINDRKNRRALYEIINDAKNGPTPQLTFEGIRTRNLYYDMYRYNTIFFENSKKIMFVKRAKLYLKYMYKIINDNKFNSYTIKSVFIDADSWNAYDKVHNPITYISYSLRKLFNDFKELGNINIYIYNSKSILRINPNECDDHSYIRFNTELKKIYKGLDLTADDLDQIIEKEVTDNITVSNPKKDNFIGATEIDEDDIDIEPIEDVVYEDNNGTPDKDLDDEEFIYNSDDTTTDELLDDNEQLLQDVYTYTTNTKNGKSTASIKRDEELKKKQKEIKFKDLTIDDYKKIKNNNPDIKSDYIGNKIKSTNPNVHNLKYRNYEKTYNEEMMPRDTVNILTNLNNLDLKVYVKDIKVEDTSTELTLKETYHVTLEDENRVRHTFMVDMPKFLDDKFLYIEGNKKLILKQMFMKPISKTAPDTVQICSNYKKIFITRYGNKLSSGTERFKRSIIDVPKVIYHIGDNNNINNKYMTTLEYDELAGVYSSVSSNGVEIIFNQEEVQTRLNGIKIPPDSYCIGFNKKIPIFMNYNTEKIKDADGELRLIDYMLKYFDKSFEEKYNQTTSGSNRYTFSRAKIMSKDVPLVLLLAYCEGLTSLLKKADINYHFSDKRIIETDDTGVIKFADGYLVYDKYPLKNSMLLNGLRGIHTSIYSYEEFDEKNLYIELFYELYGARNLANAFDSFYQFMIDPITKEILEQLNYPTDFVSVLLVGNELLCDNSFILENNMNLYRIRSNEIINGMLHLELANAYSKYRATANNKNPVKISIPRNAVMKRLMELNTVEEYSTLNPIYELEKMRTVTARGFSGMNTDRVKEDKRSYDKSMLGVIGISTSPDRNVGLLRKLTLEPNIKNGRGFIDIADDKDVDSLSDVNLFTASEMLTPLSVMHDDPIRTAMASKQSSHIIPVKNTSPVLISNGAEQIIQYYLSKDFIVVAKNDGEVVEKDDKAGYIIIKYKDDTYEAIDINSRVTKNSASGFYLVNKLECNLKVGDKIKKDNILAYESRFFRDDSIYGNRFNIGSLQKVAVMSCYSTFEDSNFITEKVAEDMSTDIVMRKVVSIGKNANIDSIVKIGDSVSVGDILVSFDTSYEDENYNKFLDSVGKEYESEIKSLNKIPIKAKYAGVIEDIKIYSSVDLEDLSPSLKRIVKGYYDSINYKKKVLNKYDKNNSVVKCGILFNETTGKIAPSGDGKIKGIKVDEGVIFEFYIKYHNIHHVGDKLTFFSALKSITGEVIPKGYEPYSLNDPDEEIGAYIGPSAILARMAPIFDTLFGNKVIVTLKKRLREIYYGE
jgi:hypothetical protein